MFTEKTLPFKIPDVFQGFAETSGIMKIEEQSLVLEFQTVDSVFGAIKSEVKNLNLPFTEIEALDFKKSIFGNKLTIRTNSLTTSSQLPNQTGCEVQLHIDKKDVEIALSFVSNVKLEVVDQRMRDAEQPPS